MKNICRILFMGLTFMFMATAVSAATFVVNTTNDTVDATPGDGTCADAATQCSLRAAISEANALAGDDIITLPAGSYTQTLVAANEDLNAGGDFDITSNITINGAGAINTNIQANAAAGAATERVVNIRASAIVTLSGVTIRNGRFTGTMAANTRGAGIENLGTLTLNNSIVSGNQLNSTTGNPIGAGIHNAGPALTFSNSIITSNVNTRVTGGSAFGGGLSSIVASAITITNTEISGNSAISQAGGFGFGAGMYLENLFTVNATGSTFNNNTGTGTSGSNGVGVRALSNIGAATFTATNCDFNNNTGTVAGAALNQGTGLQFFTTTTAAATLTVTLDRVYVNGNTGNSLGVGINTNVSTGGNMTVNVRNSTISNNTGATNGGGMSITNVGGTVNSTGTFNFTNSTISGNSATGNGGGVYVEQPAAGVITANFNFATVANNTAGNGGGVFRSTAGVVNLKNSIFGDNTAATAPDVSGSVNSQDYNHIENLTGATIGGTTTNNATGDAQLGALLILGGPTPVHLPASSSPVVNTIPNGTNDCGTPINSDQRSIPRPSSGACEKGSVERAVTGVPSFISGRVQTPGGQGIRNVTVTISQNGFPNPINTVQTGSFGNFRFDNILTERIYTITVNGKRYTFTPSSRTFTLTGDRTNEDFISDSDL